ncbi:MAG: Mur ligase family protein [Candidatus Scalindua sp.]|nr:Mur ligase family protein [Candidatus Scalindua sp.]
MMNNYHKIVDYVKLYCMFLGKQGIFLRKQLDFFCPTLLKLANFYRRSVIRKKRIVVVVGSLGKTTTTGALRSVLLKKQRKQMWSNYGSSLALNLLRSHPADQHDVFEIGINSPGRMESYAKVILPDVVVVTSIKSDHNRSFPTLNDTRVEKVKIVQSLSSVGIAVLNGDDPNVRWMASQTKAKIITYGRNPDNDIRATDICIDWPNGTRFKLHAYKQEHDVKIKLFGEKMVSAILASIATGLAEGFTLDTILPKLDNLKAKNSRLQKFELDNGAIILDDTFKAPLESIQEALKVFEAVKAKRRIVVIGDISEPQGKPRPLYFELGKQIANVADLMFFVGMRNFRGRIKSGALDGGLEKSNTIYAGTRIPKVIDLLKDELKNGDVCMIKARGTQRFRRITLALMGQNVQCGIGYCVIKVSYCDDCPLLDKGEEAFHNYYIEKLIKA